MSHPSAPVQLNQDDVAAQLAGLWNLFTPADRKLLKVIVEAATANGGDVRVTIGNLKGGVNKTTTSVFLAILLAMTGENVLLVDADSTNNSCLLWKAGVGDNWPVNLQVMPWGTADLAKRVRAMEGQFKHLIVDTPPSQEAIMRSALAVTNTIVIPCQPTPMDTAQLDKTFKVAREMDAINPDGVAAVVMFARAKSAGINDTNLVKTSYERVAEKDYPVFSTCLYDSVTYAESFPVFPRKYAGYGPLLAEMVAFALDLAEVPSVPKPGKKAGK